MKLSKSICIKCINDYYPMDPWNNGDDFEWEKGFVFCPKLDFISNNSIPEYCPFILEHITQ